MTEEREPESNDATVTIDGEQAETPPIEPESNDATVDPGDAADQPEAQNPAEA